MDQSANEPVGARHLLAAALAARGYRDHAVLGPFDGRRGAEFAATVHAGHGEPPLVLRGTFAAVRAAIEALPRRG